MFYFAWVDKGTAFSETEHAVEDESIYAFSISHAEGGFPVLEAQLRNPRVGLLGTGRKQWCWLSWTNPDSGDTEPLFYGRLVGLPQAMQNNVISLQFVARPADWDDQRATLAETLKVAPYYDALWFSDADQTDPDRVLEGYSALWHIDRLTHEVTISDIINGEDGSITFQQGEVAYDSVDVAFGQSPASRVVFDATVEWSQVGAGSIDVTPQLLTAFKGVTPGKLFAFNKARLPPDGIIATLSGQALVDNWPKAGNRVGGGWQVGDSYAKVIGDYPTLPVTLSALEYTAVQVWDTFPATDSSQWAIASLLNRGPGLVIQVIDHTDPNWVYPNLAHGSVDILWVPIWRIAPKLTFEWDAARSRTEVATFELLADVQPLLADAGDDGTIYLSAGPADVDALLHDRRSPRFFGTDRGEEAFQHLLARARAALLARARAVDITFSVPFASGVGLSCRMNAGFTDPRLPGAAAAGKVKAYSLSMDGSSGQANCTVTIGCTVGRDGTVAFDAGTPVWADDYVVAEYQIAEDEVVTPFSSDLGYTRFTEYELDDDGLDLFDVNPRNAIISIQVTGGVSDHQEEMESKQPFPSAPAAITKPDGYTTVIRVDLVPVAGGPFTTNITPEVTVLKVPRTIDLE